MTLAIYLSRRFVMAFLLVSGAFFGLLLLLDMVEQARRLTGADGGIFQVFVLSLLNAPETFYEIAPLVALLAALWVAMGLSRSSEWVVMRASGRSTAHLMAVPTLVILVMASGFVAVMNPLVASTSREYDRRLAILRGDAVSVVALSGQALWLRQADARGQTVIRARSTSPEGTLLQDVAFFVFHPTEGLSVRLQAAQAALRPGLWQLSDVKEWRLSDINPEASARSHARLEMPTDLTPEQIRDNFAQVQTIPIWQLPGFIAALERAGFAALTHRLRLHSELALPLLMAGMLLLAVGIGQHHARSGQTAIRALVTILAGFALFFLRNFAQVLGETGQIPIVLAAWGLPVATSLLALGLMLNLEDG